MGDGTRKKSGAKAGTAAGAKSSGRTRKSHSLSHEALEDVIRRRAYEIYLERGESGEGELDDWLRAEKEVRGPGLQMASST